jgi:hypothetical protein
MQAYKKEKIYQMKNTLKHVFCQKAPLSDAPCGLRVAAVVLMVELMIEPGDLGNG